MRICVKKEAKHYNFKCKHKDCDAEQIAVRDQIIIRINNDDIRQEVLKNLWSLNDLRANGTHIESAYKGDAAISDSSVNKMGKYSYKQIKQEKVQPQTPQTQPNCYFCGSSIPASTIKQHVQRCPA